VETQGQLAALRRLRCDQFQGYLLSAAVPANEFADRFLLQPMPTPQKSPRRANSPRDSSRKPG